MNGPGAASFNSVELGLFSSRIAAICEEMGAMLGRVAFSPNIRDRLDYSCALFNRRGQLLGQATHIPVHLGSIAYAMVGLVENRDWCAGDMLILNDPYRGGTHLPDVTVITPAFTGTDTGIQQTADVRVHTNAGTGSQESDTLPDAFVLLPGGGPQIYGVSPNSGRSNSAPCPSMTTCVRSIFPWTVASTISRACFRSTRY